MASAPLVMVLVAALPPALPADAPRRAGRLKLSTAPDATLQPLFDPPHRQQLWNVAPPSPAGAAAKKKGNKSECVQRVEEMQRMREERRRRAEEKKSKRAQEALERELSSQAAAQVNAPPLPTVAPTHVPTVHSLC